RTGMTGTGHGLIARPWPLARLAVGAPPSHTAVDEDVILALAAYERHGSFFAGCGERGENERLGTALAEGVTDEALSHGLPLLIELELPQRASAVVGHPERIIAAIRVKCRSARGGR